MRFVGGAWRGRPLRAPKGHTTRPTSDRVREALFDALSARLGTDLGGGAVLDLYAGTGALGWTVATAAAWTYTRRRPLRVARRDRPRLRRRHLRRS